MNDIRLYVNGEHYTISNSKVFSGGEIHVNIKDVLPGAADRCLIKCHIQSSEDLMQLILVKNALLYLYPTMDCSVVSIPYLPYARQDRVCAEGDAFSLDVFGNMLYTAGFSKIHVYDIHSKAASACIGKYIQVVEHSITDIFENNNTLQQLIGGSDVVLAAPDKGAYHKVKDLNDRFKGTSIPLLVGTKIRDPNTGSLSGFDFEYDGNISEKHVVIIDDICDGGGTFVGLAEKLKSAGVAKISLYVTHGIFSRGLAVFNGIIDHVYCTDSFRRSTVGYTNNTTSLTTIHI